MESTTLTGKSGQEYGAGRETVRIEGEEDREVYGYIEIKLEGESEEKVIEAVEELEDLVIGEHSEFEQTDDIFHLPDKW